MAKLEDDDLYGTAMIYRGARYVFEGTSEDEEVANRVADSYRLDGQKARVIRTPKKGIKDNTGNLRTERFAIFASWE